MTFQIPALGKDVRLGMLFDCRKNKFLDGSICDESIIQQATISHTNNQLNYAFTTEDTISEKTSFLDIQGSAKLSLLCGAVATRGSLKYLDDHKTYTKQARVTYKMSCKTHFNELYFGSYGPCMNRDIPAKYKMATHFASGILFGVDAVMIFDQILTSSENLQCTRKELEAKVMWFFSTSYCSEETLQSKSFNCNVNCNYYGDIELDEKPKSFAEAVYLCKHLPSKVSKNNAIPMVVWVSPLDILSKQRKPFNIVTRDTRLSKEIENKLEKYHSLKRQCNDILKDYGQACNANTQIKEKLLKIQENLVHSENTFKSELNRSVNDFTAEVVREKRLSDIVTNESEQVEVVNSLNDDIKNNLANAKVLDSFIKKVNAGINRCKPECKPDVQDLKYGLDIQVPCTAKSEITDRMDNTKSIGNRNEYILKLREAAEKVVQYHDDCSELTDTNFVINIKTVPSNVLPTPSFHKLSERERKEAIEQIIKEEDTTALKCIPNIEKSTQRQKIEKHELISLPSHRAEIEAENGQGGQQLIQLHPEAIHERVTEELRHIFPQPSIPKLINKCVVDLTKDDSTESSTKDEMNNTIRVSEMNDDLNKESKQSEGYKECIKERRLTELSINIERGNADMIFSKGSVSQAIDSIPKSVEMSDLNEVIIDHDLKKLFQNDVIDNEDKISTNNARRKSNEVSSSGAEGGSNKLLATATQDNAKSAKEVIAKWVEDSINHSRSIDKFAHKRFGLNTLPQKATTERENKRSLESETNSSTTYTPCYICGKNYCMSPTPARPKSIYMYHYLSL